MTVVYICEKPDQGLDYAKAMKFTDLNKSKGYVEDKSKNIIITWAIGHLIKLYEPYQYDVKFKYTKSLNDLPIIPDEFKFTLSDKKEEEYKKKQFEIVKKILKNATEVVIATDADREGETIGREILDLVGYKGKISRVLVSSLDEVGILKGIANKQDASKTINLYKSGVSRMTADWFIGINLSRAVTLVNKNMIEGNLPVGRIITPTVNLVYMRDMEIENFKSKDYFEVSAIFKDGTQKNIDTSWVIPKKLLDELEEKLLVKEEAQKVVDKCKNKDGKVIKAEKKRKTKAAPLPFSLLTLQTKCYSEFGYKADQVLAIAQSLYEKHKATTYPRTDCTYLPVSQFAEVPAVLSAILKTDPDNDKLKEHIELANKKQKSEAWNDSKLTAHHAIIPTTTPADISRMTKEEANVYDLIRRTYIAQFLPSYEYDSTTLEIECEGEIFRVTGSVPAKQGWKIVLNEKESKDDNELPLLKVGETVKCVEAKLESKKTKPPARYNNSTLVQAMTDAAKYIEDPELKKILKITKGLGTVATQANIIKNALRYEYIKEEKNNYVTTEKGRLLMQAVPDMIKSIETTAYWESMLEEIATGDKTSEQFFEVQKKALVDIISDMKEGKYKIETAVGMTYQCPKCNSGLKRIKSQKNGKFYWVCLDKENCKSIFQDNRGKPLEPTEREVVEQGDVEHKCTTCQNKLIRKKGQYGFYWQCSGETCKKNYKDDNMKPVEIVKKEINKDYQCPVCKKGFLVERGAQGRKFWGCSNYPKCKTIKKDDGGKPEGF